MRILRKQDHITPAEGERGRDRKREKTVTDAAKAGLTDGQF